MAVRRFQARGPRRVDARIERGRVERGADGKRESPKFPDHVLMYLNLGRADEM
jgi:hypothetical protein